MKTNVAVVVTIVAVFVAPTLAQAKMDNGSYRAAHSTSYVTRAQRLIEGRNAAGVADFGTFGGASSGRDAIVQSLGN
jgi:hypothetical protein